MEVGAETTPKSVEATSSPMVQKIKNTSGKRENPKDLKQIKLSVERWDTKQKDFSVQAVRFGTGSGCVSEFGQNWEFISYKENLKTVQKKNPSYFVELTDYLDEITQNIRRRVILRITILMSFMKEVRKGRNIIICVWKTKCLLWSIRNI